MTVDERAKKAVMERYDSGTMALSGPAFIEQVLEIYEASRSTLTPEQINHPNRGLLMSEIRVGMRLKSTLSPSQPVVTVTAITDKGFRYEHEPWTLGTRMGVSKGGERYGVDSYSYYEEVKEP